MIREFKTQDLDEVMKIWLDTNISAHNFIQSEYWESHYDKVKALMQNATVYVYEEDNVIRGFIGLFDDYIAGIFVLHSLQSKGIGKKLLDYVKDKKDALSLSVYKENIGAVKFYTRERFSISNEQLDKDTGKLELHMDWLK